MHENLQHILLSSMFWKIAAVLLIVAAADAAVFQHTALLLERDAGLGRGVAAASLSVMFGLGVVAKVAAGWVYDRWSIKGISMWYLLLAVSIALALPVAGILTLILFTTARGIAHGGLIPETAVLAQHCYGPKFMNITLPILTGIWAVGASAGPVILAMFYDSAGHYRYGLILFVALCLLAAALVRQVEPTYRFHSTAGTS